MAPRPSADAIPEPSAAWVDLVARVLEPWRRLTDPVCFGVDRIPRQGPVLVVANHTVLGAFDAPILALELQRRRGRLLRGLADRVHFTVPGWRDLLLRLGCIVGTRAGAMALLRRGEAVLVFPGGAREVMKHKGEKYRLLWGDRTGFANVAIACGVPIVPVGVVGGEEFFEILMDANHPLLQPPRWALERFAGRSELPPIVRGIGPTLIPRPARLYLAFGKPIPTRRWKGREDDPEACGELRDLVRDSLEKRIAFALRRREQDPERRLLARLVRGARSPARKPRPRHDP
jgi:1-acyl-sn-glycerol-3-phosphate acyltransferase